MGRDFGKATLVSGGAFAAGALVGFLSGFPYGLLAVLVAEIAWTLFCAFRILELRRAGSHRANAPEEARESYAFALGGSISSLALLAVLVVLSQVV